MIPKPLQTKIGGFNKRPSIKPWSAFEYQVFTNGWAMRFLPMGKMPGEKLTKDIRTKMVVSEWWWFSTHGFRIRRTKITLKKNKSKKIMVVFP